MQAENWWWERRRIGKGKFDGIFSRPLEELRGLMALLLWAFLLPFLLFPRQSLLCLFLLKVNDGEWVEEFKNTRTMKDLRKKSTTYSLFGGLSSSLQIFELFLLFLVLLQKFFLFLYVHLLKCHWRHQVKIKYSKIIKIRLADFICVAVQKQN